MMPHSPAESAVIAFRGISNNDKSRQEQKIELLKRRALLISRAREVFREAGYWEVETPLLSHDTCVDRWLDPFELTVEESRCFLQTSPEFAMKRLLCRGADAIFQVCKSFRSGEIGDQHNPEFTMIEWYRRDIPVENQIDFVEALISELLTFATEHHWIEPFQQFPFRRIAYETAFLEFAGISALLSTTAELLERAREVGWSDSPSTPIHRDDVLNYLLAMLVEPELAKFPAVSLFDFPASQAALANLRQDIAPVAERFEMYLCGKEICNGYQELTNVEELRFRMELQNQQRIEQAKPALPVESLLLRTMEQFPLPECSGVALGFDRVAMMCLGQQTLSDVLSFPFNDA